MISDLVRQYLLDAISTGKAFGQRLLGFSRIGDDEEVQLAFTSHAAKVRTQLARLRARLGVLGGDESGAKGTGAEFLTAVPSIAEIGQAAEEQLVQNLITAYCVETGECAMYEALAVAARAAGDNETEALAREIQAEEFRAAEKMFHFLPSRSKIAFNVLTAGELDPAVETKVGMV